MIRSLVVIPLAGTDLLRFAIGIVAQWYSDSADGCALGFLVRAARESTMHSSGRLISLRLCALLLLVSAGLCAQQQIVDPEFNPIVDMPAYKRDGPTVSIDEAHSNFHTASGQFRPFAELLRKDGYQVVPWKRTFETGALAGIDVLVIANANAGNFTDSAFTDAECDAVRDWVHGGGALLLIADHAPFGKSAENLAQRFDVAMGKGWVFEPTDASITTQLVFSRDNHLLGTHPILRGRNAAETVQTIKSFTGQSLGVPQGAGVLLQLSPVAREVSDTRALDAEATARAAGKPLGEHSQSVAGRAQGLALTAGKGRVVVLGEAAMLSAQVVTLPDAGGSRTFKVGMNAPGNDDRQFALNIVHWLSKLVK
jgi:hypothetical protein